MDKPHAKVHFTHVTKEINNKDWAKFCENLNNLRHDALLTLETVNPGEKNKELAANVPLQSMKFEKTDGCSDIVSLELGSSAGAHRPMRHVITEPIHFWLKTAEGEGNFNPLLIEAETGTVTARSLRRHPADEPSPDSDPVRTHVKPGAGEASPNTGRARSLSSPAGCDPRP